MPRLKAERTFSFFVALLNFGPTYYAFDVTLAFMTLTSLEGQFITPAILGRSMSMSPVLVSLSISVWGWMSGIMDVFLSVPILIAARMACEGDEELRPLAMTLGAKMPYSKALAGNGSESIETNSGDENVVKNSPGEFAKSGKT